MFVRGDPEAIRILPSTRLEGDLYALMQAYVDQRRRSDTRSYRPEPVKAYALEAARDRLRGLLPELTRWTSLTGVAPQPALGMVSAPSRASYLASTLSASLELVREGALEARQLEAFAEIYLRSRRGGGD